MLSGSSVVITINSNYDLDTSEYSKKLISQ